MQLVAFRLPGIVAHNYGDGHLVIWQTDREDPFNPSCVRVSAKKLKRKLKKFCRRL